ncbi:MAG: primosomal protein N' [Candidatus Rokuibacteriota bacterium]|nr:MAG: primosomal protein N' [Candidatus Rokubacteria bacterium]
MTIADVAFDVPLAHSFAYRVPDGWTLGPGQRVLAPLRGASRVGMIVTLREDGADAKLKALDRVVDGEPVLSPAHLDLVHWIAVQSLSSVGSTCAALLPPPPAKRAAPTPSRQITHAATRNASDADTSPGARPELLVGAGREKRALERIEAAPGTVLVIAADIETAARWAQRLARLGRVVRLDSGVPDAERVAAWDALRDGSERLAAGTRSALLAPLVAPATVVLVDEHEAAHKPPGPPRIHSRDVALERAARERLTLLLTSATPSVEAWRRAESGLVDMATPPRGPWPVVSVADTRGILRREPLTPPLARAIRETLAARRRVFLAVSRLTSSLACDECGTVVRCAQCAIALAYPRAAARLVCRLCATSQPLPDTCAVCHGRRLSPFGWGAERVEHAVRRRFPDARIARWDPDAARGARAEAQRAAAAAADVVIGTRGALRLFGPAALGLAAFVSPDQLLRAPDFRAGERALAFAWAAAERVAGDGVLVIQSQNPGHYAFEAVARQDLHVFYQPELKFRAELGYPPFRRLAVVTARAAHVDETRRLGEAVAAALRARRGLAVYPPSADRGGRAQRVVAKGDADLPNLLDEALREFTTPRAASRGIIDVEVDPVEWQF